MNDVKKPKMDQELFDRYIATLKDPDYDKRVKEVLKEKIKSFDTSGLNLPDDINELIAPRREFATLKSDPTSVVALKKKLSQQELDDAYKLYKTSPGKVSKDALLESIKNTDLTNLNVPDDLKQAISRDFKKTELYNPPEKDVYNIKGGKADVTPEKLQYAGDEFKKKMELKEIWGEALEEERRHDYPELYKSKPVTKSVRPEVGKSLRSSVASQTDDITKSALKGGAKKAFAVLGGPLTQVGIPLAAAALSGDIYAADPSGSETAGMGSDTQKASIYERPLDNEYMSPERLKRLNVAAENVRPAAPEAEPSSRQFDVLSTNPVQLRPLDVSDTPEPSRRQKMMGLYNDVKDIADHQNYQDVDEKFKFFKGKSPEEVDEDLEKMGFKIEKAPAKKRGFDFLK